MNINAYKNDPLYLVERQIIISKKILSESCKGLTIPQRDIVEGVYQEFLPLIKQTVLVEKTLTADELNTLFASVEKGATEAGGNRTGLGKGIDVAKQANDVINSVGRWLQNTAPVQAFDQKFESLKDQINKKFPDSKILDVLTDMGTFAKENPGKTAAIIGVLTAVAALAGGPVGGAIAGQILRGSSELLKGEKLSTAIGKGLKTAAVGWLAGMTMDKVGDLISNIYSQFNPVPVEGFAQYYQSNVGNGLPNVFRDATIYGSEEQLDQFQSMWGAAVKQWQSGDFEGARAAFGQAQDFAARVSSETLDQITVEGDPAEKIRLLNQALDGLSAAAQGAAAGATAFDKQGNPVQDNTQPAQQKAPTPTEALIYNLKPLSESMLALMFKKVAVTNHQMLSEGKLWEQGNEPEGQKPTFMQKVMGKASEVGKNLTTKTTASKLMNAWKAAKLPPDSDSVGEFLKQQGVNDQVIAQTFKDMQLPAPGTGKTTAEIADIKKQIAELGPESAKKLMAFLAQRLGAA